MLPIFKFSGAPGTQPTSASCSIGWDGPPGAGGHTSSTGHPYRLASWLAIRGELPWSCWLAVTISLHMAARASSQDGSCVPKGRVRRCQSRTGTESFLPHFIGQSSHSPAQTRGDRETDSISQGEKGQTTCGHLSPTTCTQGAGGARVLS